jgi:hypothetical protein
VLQHTEVRSPCHPTCARPSRRLDWMYCEGVLLARKRHWGPRKPHIHYAVRITDSLLTKEEASSREADVVPGIYYEQCFRAAASLVEAADNAANKASVNGKLHKILRVWLPRTSNVVEEIQQLNCYRSLEPPSSCALYYICILRTLYRTVYVENKYRVKVLKHV